MTRAAHRLIAVLVGLGVLAASACGGSRPVSAPAAATVAFLRATASPGGEVEIDAFLAEMAAAGYVVGDSLMLVAEDPDEAHPDPREAAGLAARWGREGYDIIVALSTTGARIAAQAAPDARVLFISNDPTATGLVDDERHPEGNLTGVTFRVPADRLLDLARQVVSPLETVGVLVAEDDPASGPSLDAAVDAIEQFGLLPVVASIAGEPEIPAAVDELAGARADVVLLTNSPTLAREAGPVQGSVKRVGLPAVAATSVFDQSVLVLQPDTTELYRQLGRQASRLLQGTPVAQVPVEDPARFRLVVNAAVAGDLGLRIPPSILEAADQVIR